MYDKVFLNYLLEVDHQYISELPGSQCKETHNVFHAFLCPQNTNSIKAISDAQI